MGTWGTSLYSGDFAADLRSTIAAVSRLPFDAGPLVDVVCDVYPDASNNPEDEEHTIFWLVLADQFCKRGIDSKRVRDTALAIIESEADLAAHADLGMTAADLRKRRQVLDKLRFDLKQPPSVAKPRKTLKAPQPLLMQVGDLWIYPTSKGEMLNPYFNDELLARSGWEPDGWGAMLIIDAGRAFDFLAWYRALTLFYSLERKPGLDELMGPHMWVQRFPGTLSRRHLQRMRLEKVSQLAVDESRRRHFFPNLSPGIDAAVKDISIANEMSIGPKRKDFYHWKKLPDGDYGKVPYPTLSSLAELTNQPGPDAV